MTRTHLAVLVVVLLAPSLAAAQPLKPPPDLALVLDRARDGPDRAAAVLALAARDDAAPYLRSAVRHATERAHARDLGEALELIAARTYARNLTRAASWAPDARFDLLTSFLSECKPEDARPLVGLVMKAQARIGEEAALALGLSPPLSFLGRSFPRVGPLELQGDRVDVKAPVVGPAVIRAREVGLHTFNRTGWLVIAGDQVTERCAQGYGDWGNSVILANNDIHLGVADRVLVICDGDVHVPFGHSHCVILANGSIYTKGGPGSSSHLYSADRKGDVRRSQSHPRAPGGSPADLSKAAHSGAPIGAVRPSFGVRFLDPREFGLELAAQNGGVQVMGVTPDSPFARQGVRDADVITAVDDAEPRTVADFRRALRKGVIRESVVLRIRRDDLDLTRVVYLDGVPLPVAPAPRAVDRR